MCVWFGGCLFCVRPGSMMSVARGGSVGRMRCLATAPKQLASPSEFDMSSFSLSFSYSFCCPDLQAWAFFFLSLSFYMFILLVFCVLHPRTFRLLVGVVAGAGATPTPPTLDDDRQRLGAGFERETLHTHWEKLY